VPAREPLIHLAAEAEYGAARALANAAPAPCVVGRICCATAGWTDATLVKDTDFYPRGQRSPRGRLEYYSRLFPYVEVDATYYALLPPENALNWLSWTPASFCFDVKANPVLTGHPIDTARLPADLKEAAMNAGAPRRAYAERLPTTLSDEIERRFRAFVSPLLEQGRLSCVLLQFPPWFTATQKNARHIESVARRWEGVPLAVEFRHASWLEPSRSERTLALLARHALSFVNTDAPTTNGAGSPSLLHVTNPKLALVRFHGHNVRGWATKGATVHERFSYLYSPMQVRAWTSPLRTLAARAENVHATFNNCYRDYAVISARELGAALTTESTLDTDVLTKLPP
jgi:uncharacterized protein YecE (DUF72 family)